MAEGDDEDVPPAHGEPVSPCIGKVIPGQDIFFSRVTEGAAMLGLGYGDHPFIHYQGIIKKKVEIGSGLLGGYG